MLGDGKMTRERKGALARKFDGGQEFLKEICWYHSDNGYIEALGVYNVTGRQHGNGYNYIKLPVSRDHTLRGNRKTEHYRVDHIAWLYVVGFWPVGHIEHLNGLLHDDAIENLVFRDLEGRRFWWGVRDDTGYPGLMQIEGDEGSNTPLVDILYDGGKAVIKPRVAGGWAQGADQVVSVEPAPAFEKGEFGKDWK